VGRGVDESPARSRPNKMSSMAPPNPALVQLVFDRTQHAAFAVAVYRLRDEDNPVLQKLADYGHEGGAIVARAAQFVLNCRTRR
jgi:hypothetical protein